MGLPHVNDATHKSGTPWIKGMDRTAVQESHGWKLRLCGYWIFQRQSFFGGWEWSQSYKIRGNQHFSPVHVFDTPIITSLPLLELFLTRRCYKKYEGVQKDLEESETKLFPQHWLNPSRRRSNSHLSILMDLPIAMKKKLNSVLPLSPSPSLFVSLSHPPMSHLLTTTYSKSLSW